MDKRAENLIFPIVIFIVLNLVFFSLLLAFVFKSSTGAGVYEQAYAKQIALLVDQAKPVTQINLDFTKGLELAGQNKLSSEQKKNLVSFKNNEVRVKLHERGGYSFKYFSDYEVNSYFNENSLIIIVNEKKENET